MPTILTLDQGNTSLKGVLWDGGQVLQVFRWMRPGNRKQEIELPFCFEQVSRVLGLASRGLPQSHGLPGLPAGEWVGSDLDPPLQVDYEAPEEMGWDRRVAAFALICQCPEGGLILDAGTCLTLTHVDSSGLCRGFGIAPGLAALAGTFATFAPDLARDQNELPRHFPLETRSTQKNLAAGIWAAFLGAARELLALGRKRLEALGVSPGDLFLTGSDGNLLASALGEGELDPLLVHRGLLFLGEGQG